MRCPKCGSDKLMRGGHSRGKARYKCSKNGVVCWHGTMPIGIEDQEAKGVPSLNVDKIHARILSGKIKRYVITSAQNATPVWKPAFKSLLKYCEHHDAQLLVIPYRYRNPTSLWSSKNESDDWWAEELQPYLYDRRVDLCRHLTLLADIKTQPTNSRPLTGYQTISGGKSAIVGHPKLELETVATPQQHLPKIITTTAAITKKNYIPAKLGKIAAFHHTFGACVVEMEGDFFYPRQINMARDGSFCDLDYEYSGNKRPKKIRAEGLDMGDTHVDFADPQAVKATFEEMVPLLRPKALVWHDVLDSYANSPHHENEVFIRFAKHHSGRNNVEAEVDRCFAFVDKYSPKYAKNIFPYSNHPDMLARWVKRTDPRSDPENCVFWAKTFAAMCETSTITNTGASTADPFAMWAKSKLKSYKRSKFLGPTEGYQIKAIEVGYHGHVGPGGARGSLMAFTKIGVKNIIAHLHVCGIKEGAYQVGTTSYLQAEYVKGPNAWLHVHCVIYPNGKRSLIIIINGKFRRGSK